MSRWQQYARPIIAEAIENNKDLPEKELRKEIDKVYPFQERKARPFHVWSIEVDRQIKEMKADMLETQSGLF
jgi:hypothetical protein